jgi:tyrosyl-DNA phosphodiesterase 1
MGAQKGYPYGHPRLGHLLGKHSPVIDESSPIVCQSSSIGSLGPSPEAWVTTELFGSLRRDSGPMLLRRIPPFKMIYPSFNNVRTSHDNLIGGGCLPYGKAINDKQPWLKQYLW